MGAVMESSDQEPAVEAGRGLGWPATAEPRPWVVPSDSGSRTSSEGTHTRNHMTTPAGLGWPVLRDGMNPNSREDS
jgi:hypothetical protein